MTEQNKESIEVGTEMKSAQDGHVIIIQRIDASMILFKFNHLKGKYAMTHETLLKHYKRRHRLK